jgi:hypothetical protein
MHGLERWLSLKRRTHFEDKVVDWKEVNASQYITV